MSLLHSFIQKRLNSGSEVLEVYNGENFDNGYFQWLKIRLNTFLLVNSYGELFHERNSFIIMVITRLDVFCVQLEEILLYSIEETCPH